MVEFAVDDVRKVKEREERQRRLEKMREIKAKIIVDKANAAAGRRQRQRRRPRKAAVRKSC